MEIDEKLEGLLDTLKNSRLVKNYLNAKENVLKDKDLIEQLQHYHQTQDITFKQQILANKTYQIYHDASSCLSILIWGMNLKFKNGRDDITCGLSKESIKAER